MTVPMTLGSFGGSGQCSLYSAQDREKQILAASGMKANVTKPVPLQLDRKFWISKVGRKESPN